MSDAVLTAVIAGSSAVFGGLVTAIATRGVERLRLEAAAKERSDERLLASMLRFRGAARHWSDWRVHMTVTRPERDEAWSEAARRENNERIRELRDARANVELLCSDDLLKWLTDTYDPSEQRFQAETGAAMDAEAGVTTTARDAIRAFDEVIDQMVKVLRREISGLR